MRLDERDLRSVLAAAEALAAVDDPTDFADAAFVAARRVVGCDFVMYTEMDLRRARSIVVSDPPELVDDARILVWERYMEQHPVLQHATRTLDPSARTIADFLTRPELHRLELYDELYRELGIEDQAGFLVRLAPKHAIGVSLSRGTSFSERERTVFDALRPHLTAASRRVEAQARLRERIAALERGVDSASVGLLTLDRDGRLRYASTAATRLLLRHFGRVVPLREPVAAWWPGKTVGPLVLASRGRQLVLHALEDGVSVFVEEKRLPPSLESFGLTRREAEVVVRAARRATNEEIARELGIRPRTVAKHLEHAYEKLGVRGRREAAEKLTPSLPD